MEFPLAMGEAVAEGGRLIVSVEQIKGPEEVRDRIVAAARNSRQGPDCPPELRPEYNPSQHPLCDHLIHYHEHHISHNGTV